MTQTKAVQKSTNTGIAREITDQVLTRINQFVEGGMLTLPKDYRPENALKAAHLVLMETKDKQKNPVLQSCSKESITMALLKMVVEGLNPLKKQCAFIAYGNKLICQRQYQGNMAIAKRVAAVDETKAILIYKGDDFKYSPNTEMGGINVITHQQEFQNVKDDNILGGYAVVTFKDSNKIPFISEPMNMEQIKKAWSMGQGETKTHKDFPGEMAKKTIINRALKGLIDSSVDEQTIPGQSDDETYSHPKEAQREAIEKQSATHTLDTRFDEYEEVSGTEEPDMAGPPEPEEKEAPQPKEEKKEKEENTPSKKGQQPISFMDDESEES